MRRHKRLKYMQAVVRPVSGLDEIKVKVGIICTKCYARKNDMRHCRKKVRRGGHGSILQLTAQFGNAVVWVLYSLLSQQGGGVTTDRIILMALNLCSRFRS